jgi:ComF family protein
MHDVRDASEPMLAPPLCWACGGPARRGEPLCLTCRGGMRRLPGEQAGLPGVELWAPLAYEGAARELVRALKFRGARGVADAMAAQIAASAPPQLFEGRALVPVPLHPRRRRRRGFNQARALTECLAWRLAIPWSDCLSRFGSGAPQVGRGRSERRGGPSGTIAAEAPVPAHPVLVDDVVTTGATLAACAAALRLAGAAEVTALAFARTPGR